MMPGWAPTYFDVQSQGAEGVARSVKQQGTPHRAVGEPERMEVVGQGKDDRIRVTGQDQRWLKHEPALGLEAGTWGAGPMAARIIPEACGVTIWTGLHMTASRRRPARHDRTRGSADVAGQGMGLLISRISGWENSLERHEGHRCLCTRHGTIVGVFFLTVSRKLSPLQAVSPTLAVSRA